MGSAARMRYEALTPGMSSTSFLDNFYRQYDFSKAPDFRGLSRSVSQTELFSPTSSMRSGMNSKMSTSSMDISPGRPYSSSPQPIQAVVNAGAVPHFVKLLRSPDH